MEYIRKKYEQLSGIVIAVTKIYEQHVTDYKFMPAVAAYVYFMKVYFEYKYEYEVNILRKKYDEKVEIEIFDKLSNDINNAAGALNKAFSKIGEKYKIEKLITKKGRGELRKNVQVEISGNNESENDESIYDNEISGNSESIYGNYISGNNESGNYNFQSDSNYNELFYHEYKTKLSKWTDKTPRDKIIRTLETWFNIRGEDAVIYTLHRMQNDANLLFDHVLSLHNYKSVTNYSLNRLYNSVVQRLIKYYITHRNRYVHVVESRDIKIKNGIRRVMIRDSFIDLNIKFKDCEFSRFGSTVRTIIDALNKLDVHIAHNMIDSNNVAAVDMGTDINIRRDLKQRIVKIVEDISEDAICVDINKINTSIPSGSDVGAIIIMVKKFIELEQAAEEELETIKKLAQLQVQNIQRLHAELDELCGPSTVPCLRRVMPGINFILRQNNKNFTKKGKLSVDGEATLKSLL